MSKKTEVDFDVGTVLQVCDLAEAFNLFPRAGGSFDQDSLFMHFFQIVGDYKAKRAEIDKRRQGGQHPRTLGGLAGT